MTPDPAPVPAAALPAATLPTAAPSSARAPRAPEVIVREAEDLLYDLEFAPARRWKAAAPGRRVVGYMPVYAPREVVTAAGAMALGISGAGDWLEVIRGDAYYQSYLCHIPRSTIEMAVSNRLDFLDGMLFPSTCDVIRNLSGMWQLLRKDTYVRYLDVPQNFDAGIGGRFWEHELRSLGGELGALTGHAPSDDDLRRAIRIWRDNRHALLDLYALRRARPDAVPTSEAYLVTRAGNVLPVEEHTALVREYAAAASERPEALLDQTRVVVVGAFCEQPPIGLLRTIERSGCAVVDDDFLLVSRWFTKDVDETGDPWAALADAFVRHTVPTAVMYSPKAGRGGALVERVRAAGAEGVIFAAPSFCTPALLDQPMLVEALDAAGIPYTAFKYAENTGQFQPIREQTGTFADSVRLWSASGSTS